MPRAFPRLLSLFVAAMVLGCTPPPPAKPAPPTAYVSIGGKVVDENGRPVADALVSIDGKAVAKSNAAGLFGIRRTLDPGRLALGVTAPGRVSTARPMTISMAGEVHLSPLVLRSRAAPTVLSADRGGQAAIGSDGSLTIPPNAFVTADGQPARGRINISVTPIGILDSRSLAAAPGDFTARDTAGVTAKLQSFGMFDLAVTDAEGKPLSVAKGVELPFTLRVPERLRPGPSVGLYLFDQTSGYWARTGALRQIEPLVYSGVITGTGQWNGDDPYETTCIKVQVYSVDDITQAQIPFPNAEVRAIGMDYAGTSIGFTNAAGLVCLLVKRDATVEILAFSGNWGASPMTYPTPNIQSGSANCADDVCPLVASIKMELGVGEEE
ncbi:hypothetical protein GVN21_05400 [Caulobacter sp. SLTY]|uniref:carboxypeptidase-like regulatory domain-containing protein n=1 Tax=Caulobacter sp. SLTY TaxID=2683262 RepID=UPI0014135D4A|nr:carboxypeptidase-like regulatory domain-containing protein [Caulobacter sp. SLTY]NBB14799.1 hypothetical protein [Caulobacter sp. SLTY]